MAEEKPAWAKKTKIPFSLFDTKSKISNWKEAFPKIQMIKAWARNIPMVVRTSKEVPSWAYWSGFTLALILLAMIMYTLYHADHTRTSLYSRAEELMNQGHNEAAIQLYREYKLRYPGDNTIPEINKLITRIQRNESEFTQKQIRIFELMQKAAEAFNKRHYLIPEEENAIHYISKILQEDPEFIPALELQNRIIDFYFTQAESALNKDRYDKAVAYYKNLLLIKPSDPLIRNALERSLKLKSVYGTLDKSGGLSQAKADYKNLQSEKYKLITRIREERQRLKGISQQLENKENSTSEKSTASDKNPSTRVIMDNEPMTASMAVSNPKKLAVYNQWIQSLFKPDADQNSTPKEGQIVTESSKNVKQYPVESKAMNESPVEFKSKKLVTN